MTEMHMVQALNSAMDNMMKEDKSVIILGEDVGVDGGVFRVTDGLLKKYGNKRVFDTPLAEAGIVGSSIGLSIKGFKPVAEIQFMGFVLPAMQQIVAHAARMRNRSRGKYSCPLVIRMPCQGGVKALEHHSESTETFFAHTAGLKVVMPSTPYDAKGLLISAIKDPDPVIFLEPKKLYRSIKQEVPEEAYEIPIGKANVLVEGSDITMVSWGSMMRSTLEAAEKLVKEGVNPEVIDLRTISPMDHDTIIKSVKKTGRCIIVHEAARTGGMGAEIMARINERAFYSLEAPIKRVTGYDIVIPLPMGEDCYFPDGNKVYLGAKEVLEA
ncbi:MAG: alpha-ketoacid dehydrogenase subunit beta [archaeon]|jgi:pyruvate dehydrogenase E1 component beta subunit|nr:alpha-ketoacid dehydrogenase subunit beta [Euryarchaeota archaeon]MDP6704092.1 alpha-ketoacid dehydrogenase subunit beta [archaeon]|tara:strand:- start:5578 stop:6555 length:978 start_codon:yes stop_codon:yes gene_type:complete